MPSHLDILSLIPTDASCAVAVSVWPVAGAEYFYGYWFSHDGRA